MPLSQPGESIFGRYEILRRLAVGGMGEIFLARQRGVGGFDRLAILKSLLPEFAEQSGFVTQFLDEARVAATLNHPNIVSIYEVGEWEGTYFLAMEYIHGESAASLITLAKKAGRPVPLPIVARIVQHAALGLDHAHHALDAEARPLKLVHRDVSPQNLMVRIDGVTKVVDFGVAQAANRLTRTAAGVLKGKLPYMSPEQIGVKPLDGRADQFSLGAVLWELIVGRRLFQGENDAKVLQAVVREPIPKPSQVVRQVSPELDATIMRMLARDPLGRFALMADVVRALQPLLDQWGEAASEAAVGRFVQEVAGPRLRARIEEGSSRKSLPALESEVTSTDHAAPGSGRLQAPPQTSGQTPGSGSGRVLAPPRTSGSASGRAPTPSRPGSGSVRVLTPAAPGPGSASRRAPTSPPQPATEPAPVQPPRRRRVARTAIAVGALVAAVAAGVGMGAGFFRRPGVESEVPHAVMTQPPVTGVAPAEPGVDAAPEVAERSAPSEAMVRAALVSVACTGTERLGFFIDGENVITPAAACSIGESQQVRLVDGVLLVGTTVSRDDRLGFARLKVVGASTVGLRAPPPPAFARGQTFWVPKTFNDAKLESAELVTGIKGELGIATVRAAVSSAPVGAPMVDDAGAVMGMVLEPAAHGGSAVILPAHYFSPPEGEARTAWASIVSQVEAEHRRILEELDRSRGKPLLLSIDAEPPGVFVLAHLGHPTPSAFAFELVAAGAPACALRGAVESWRTLSQADQEHLGGSLVRLLSHDPEARSLNLARVRLGEAECPAEQLKAGGLLRPSDGVGEGLAVPAGWLAVQALGVAASAQDAAVAASSNEREAQWRSRFTLARARVAEAAEAHSKAKAQLEALQATVERTTEQINALAELEEKVVARATQLAKADLELTALEQEAEREAIPTEWRR
jgi:serine/threonine-protein kinase